MLGCLFPSRLWKNKEKLTKLYEKSSEKIDHHLNIVKIIKNLKYIKILMKNSLMDKYIK